MHLAIVLLSPSRLRFGQLRQQQEVSAPFGRLEIARVTVNVPSVEQRHDQVGDRPIIERVVFGVFYVGKRA